MTKQKKERQQWPVVRQVAHKNGTKAWLVDARIHGSGQRFFYVTRQQADTKADLLRTQRKNEGYAGIQIPERLRIEALECEDQLKPFKKTLRDAVKFYLPHLKAMNRNCTVEQLKTEIIDAKRQDGMSKRYLQDLESRLGQFVRTINCNNVAEITSTQTEEWLRSRTVSAVTRNNFRRVLVVAFNFAKKKGYCVENPAAQTSQATEVESEVSILTVDQLSALLTNAGEKILPFLALGAFAGLRRAELERLDWSEVDLSSKLIEVKAKKAKSAQRRFVKIEPNLEKWISTYVQPAGAITPSDYRQILDGVRKAAGILTWPQNALRHSYASYHLAHFNDAAALALQIGHTNSNLVFQHYRQLVKPKEAARYWEIKPAKKGQKKIVQFAVA
jgi:integrase